MRKFRSRRDGFGVQKYNEARCEFLKLLERQEVYWKQRAKQFWLKEGDQNTRFFHSFASGKKKNNQIARLKDKHGIWVDSVQGVQEIVTDYFSEVFKSSGTGGYLSENETVNRVTNEQNAQLLTPISSDEVKDAVFSMHAEKAPGYDGLNPYFYQTYWSIVEKDVMGFCQQFFHTAFEVNHYIKRRSQGVHGVVGLKIDVSKAYDRLEWNFIEGMMAKFGFHDIWIQRIMTCIKTVTYKFIQQGVIFVEVKLQKGVRQGDPISPYIYILCAEGLSSIIKRHEDVGLLHGCSIARGAPTISHLLFADDCYFFFKAAEARVMKRIIKRYEELSGQAVNFNKSMITFRPNTSAENRELICGILEVQESRIPGKYLGIPMAVGRKKNEVFNFLSDRVRQKLQGWQNQTISKAAKQGWRLLNYANPLVTSIMKARYFPNNVFLEAKLGQNPSYMWRSILAAQEVVKQGCRMNIGTGEDTFVWKIPWLPCAENGYVTTNMPLELENIKVSSLMEDQARRWDDEILNDLFNARDVKLIKNIPLSSRERRDRWMWMWRLDEKGEFAVKSCYRQLVGECSTPDVSFWKKMWNLDLPGKVRFFMWRTCRLCLPTAMALIEKRVNIDSKCTWCRVANEDAKHVLFECIFARNVWSSVGMSEWTQAKQGETIFDHVKRLFSSGTNEQCALLALFCWSIWNRRIKWVWSKIAVSVFGTTSAAMSLLTEWKKTQLERTRSTSAVNSTIFGDNGTIVMGGVIRDETGRLLRTMCKQRQGSWSPREAEALSLKEVFSWTKRHGFTRCVFETDCKSLADACNGGSGRSYFHSIVSDCVELFNHFDDVIVQFVHRSANAVAHLLARVSRSMSDLREWEDVVPNFLSDVISYDLF
ncbi:hypothetical protein AgCh_013243 [Apium graveolens]